MQDRVVYDPKTPQAFLGPPFTAGRAEQQATPPLSHATPLAASRGKGGAKEEIR